MKITLLEPLIIPDSVLDGYLDALRTAGHTVTAYDTRSTDPAELSRRIGDSDAAILGNTPLPGEVIRGAKNLKLLNVAFTGIDHIDLAACREMGVTVCNAAGYSTQCVAEMALGLAIACLRFVPQCDKAARTGGVGAPLRGREIAGRTVGIVGTGAIGSRTAKLFLAFGARVIAYSRTEKPELAALGVEYVSLETLMRESDLVSLHVPSNAQTRGLISRALLESMKPTAVLINTARGAVVDNAALADCLNAGKLSAAGIDVFDMEPPIPQDYPLLHAKNTVLAPHVAFATDESMLRRAEIVFRNVDAFLAGKPENVCKL